MRKLNFRLFIYFLTFLFTECGSKDSKQFSNHLSKASSPYLQEHADNPVDWYEWGEEALAKARNENKPLIISIGYASCHWCHVMEDESFMDTTVARIMNEHFVAIKIDREERPDIDQVYINAAQLITGNAGWPLNAFALPDGKPFYAATYFPKEQWIEVLKQVWKMYDDDKSNLVQRATAITEGVQSAEWIDLKITKVPEFDRKAYSKIVYNWYPHLDSVYGGIKGYPKFPMPAMWEFLLQYHYLTGDRQALALVQTTLNEMAKGGIYDQLAGGFARYATDSIWQIPHFEKMLYDNAQLVSLYAHAYQLTKNPAYARTLHETLSFINQDLTSPEGGFYSSLNADSESEEGKYYVWKKSEVESLLDEKSAALMVDYFNLTDEGNWEKGKNILFCEFNREDFANKTGMDQGPLENILDDARKIMLEKRRLRVPPSRDDKIISSWNALMLNGFVDAFLATGETPYLDAAVKNANFITAKMMQPDGKLFRIYKDNKTSIDAFLDDYAQLTRAFIHLYQATLDVQWLERSRLLTVYAIAHFYDRPSGLFFYTSNLAPELVARKMELNDDVIPSSNSVMAENLLHLGNYYDQKDFQDMSVKMTGQLRKNILSGGPYFANWAFSAGVEAYMPFEVAVMGPDAVAMVREMQSHYLPTALFLGGEKENLPLLENKLVADATIIYVCRNKTCKLPVKSVEKALEQIRIR